MTKAEVEKWLDQVEADSGHRPTCVVIGPSLANEEDLEAFLGAGLRVFVRSGQEAPRFQG